jgi:hypothetical protein
VILSPPLPLRIILAADHGAKRYGDVTALDAVSLELAGVGGEEPFVGTLQTRVIVAS